MKRFLSGWLALLDRSPLLVGFILIMFVGAAAYIAKESEIEAFPEFTNVQVQVISQYAGKAAEEVERRVTVPLEVATTGLPGLIGQRSISTFGLSVITLTFDDNVKARQARLDVSQRLSDADLPDGVKPSLSPDTTPVGEIYRYVLKGPLPVAELKLIQDWQLEREFKRIPGVADVVSFGGPTRTVDVRLDVARMKAMGLNVANVAQALGQNHANAGGAMITHGEEGYVVRSIGMYERPEDLESAVIATQRNVPVRVRDVGSVELGHRPRLGIVGHNETNDAVEGIVLLRQGSDSLKTCETIREKIEQLNASGLPAEVKIQPIYKRTDLINRSSHTVVHNITFGIILVVIMLLFGLGPAYWPMTLAVALNIPFSLGMVFVILKVLGFAPNLISLGAVDFGIIIETAIFAAEGAIVALARRDKLQNQRDDKDLVTSMADVFGPALLCAFLLLIAFIPILSLQRVEGRIFRPLGITLIAALIGGQIGALIFVPLAARFCPSGPQKPIFVDRWLDYILGHCERIGKRLLNTRALLAKSGVALAVIVLLTMMTMGREFLPALNEGSLYIRTTAPSTISFEAATDLSARMRERVREVPEVIDAISQTGRPDDGTDVNGLNTTEILVSLKPPDEWTSARDLDGLTHVLQKKLDEFEGVEFNFSQPIKDNVDEAISGVKGELVIKIVGPQLDQLQKLADQVTTLLKNVRGAEDVGSEQLFGQPEMRFKVNRDLLARYGLRVTDAEDVLETALAGKFAARLNDEQGRGIDIMVKPDLPEPTGVRLLASLPVLTADGAKVPLGEVSEPALNEGVARVYRESGLRRIAVKCSVRGRAVVDFVEEASRKIASDVKMPPHYQMQWSGSFENAQRAGRQLMFVVPLCMLTIIIILATWFSSWRPVGFVLWEAPFAALGGFLLLRLFGLNFSISAAAGGIVLLGVSFLTGMMLVTEYLHVRDVWAALRERGRSILLSSGVAIIGLVPAALSRGIGSETAKPFAVMILGGLITSLILTMLLLPALIQVSAKLSPADAKH